MNFVRTLNITPDGVIVEFAARDDVKESGLVRNQSLLIPYTEEFADLLDDLIETCQRTLATALTAFEQAPVLQLDEPRPPGAAPDDDDEVSPYDNPLERPGVTP